MMPAPIFSPFLSASSPASIIRRTAGGSTAKGFSMKKCTPFLMA